MSVVKISGNTGGTGIFHLRAPNSSTDRFVTLPDKAGPIAVGAGTIVQVQQTVVRSRIVFTSSEADAITCDITPTSTSNKILAQWDLIWGRGQDDYGAFWLYQGNYITGAQGSDGTGNMVNATGQISNRGNNASDVYFQQASSGRYLDSPASTSTLTYKIRARCTYGTNIVLNSSYNQNNAGHTVHGISSLTLMEVVA